MITIKLLQFTLVDTARVLLLWCLDIENAINTKLSKVSNIRVIQRI